MTVSVVLDFRFNRTPDGSVWTKTTYSNAFWQRYRCVFDQVRVVARVADVPSVPEGWQQVDGRGVSVAPVPHYLGPGQYAMRQFAVRKAVRNAFNAGDAVIIRALSQLGNTLVPRLARIDYPFGLEVGGDPHEAFSPNAVQHPLRPLFRMWFTRALRNQCRLAPAVAYVTEFTLQKRYPCAAYSIGASDVEISDESLIKKPRAFTTFYSNVELKEEAFVEKPLSCKNRNQATLIFVGSLAQMYKGPDVLLTAAQQCISHGIQLRVVMIGDGKHRPELESLAERLGIAGQVTFMGEVSAGPAVRRELDKADIFVLPSRTEGLPRAMVEAMARGLPCIGTSVGGMVELLPPKDLVPPGDAPALAAKIASLVGDSDTLHHMSMRNLAKAHEYRDDILYDRRVAFYRHLRDCTEGWMVRKLGRRSVVWRFR